MKTATDPRSYKITPSEVDVTVRGMPDILNSLNEKDIEVYVNLTDILEVKNLRRSYCFSARWYYSFKFRTTICNK
jgi:hypothetical protein